MDTPIEDFSSWPESGYNKMFATQSNVNNVNNIVDSLNHAICANFLSGNSYQLSGHEHYRGDIL